MMLAGLANYELLTAHLTCPRPPCHFGLRRRSGSKAHFGQIPEGRERVIEMIQSAKMLALLEDGLPDAQEAEGSSPASPIRIGFRSIGFVSRLPDRASGSVSLQAMIGSSV